MYRKNKRPFSQNPSRPTHAGTYLDIHDGEPQSSYYVSQVDHTFRPFHEFITDVHVERGKAAQSLYLAERRSGVY